MLAADDRAIKIASRALIKNCSGGEGAAATLAYATGRGVRQQRMSDCGNIDKPDFLRIDEVGHLEDVAARDASWPPVTRALAARHGFHLVAVSQVRADTVSGSHLINLSRLSKEAGDVGSILAEALADGKIDETERTEIQRQIAELQQVAAQMNADLAAAASGEELVQ